MTPKVTSFSDAASQGTGALKAPAFFAYSTNYLIDTAHAIIFDVEASHAIRQAEVGATRTMLTRTQDRFDLFLDRLAADTACGSGNMLGWLDQASLEVSAKSPTAAALKYIGKYWDGMIMFLTDGRIALDSKAVERTIRPIALQRKNALFAGHEVVQKRVQHVYHGV